VTARQIERVRRALEKAGHGKFAKRALALARPALSIKTRRAGKVKLAPGTSRIGGAPDLLPGAKWPSWKRQPQFFYDPEQRTWGFDPKDRGSWRVLLQKEIGKPARAPGVKPYPACRLAFEEVTTPVSGESFDYETLAPSEAQHEAYGEAMGAVEEELDGDTRHQLLGNAIPIQGDMQLECQLASNGLYCGDPSGYQTRRARKLAPAASRWRLLFQLDSDDRADMMWGDSGCLYFWITDEALGARRFNESWMVLQCF
jgi:uncharacterized protein YwqG